MLTLLALRGFAQLRAPAKHRRNAFAAKVGTALLTKSLHLPQKKKLLTIAHMTCSFGFGGGRKVPPYRTVLMVIYCIIFLGGTGTPRIQVGTSIKEK